MIPTNQTVTLVKDGGLDVWGEPTQGATSTLSCWITEHTKLVRNQNGEEAVSTAFILFKGFVSVTFEDRLRWTREDGVTREEVPLTISVKRDLSGKPLITRVDV